ncbi:MAG: 4Fe-4S binding protein [Thermoplasmata archaeon]|nr:4Fe-4S binding protein [Thermoplasmata archaeon]
MKVDVNLCMHCGACVGLCPQNAIFLDDTRIEFNDDCVSCGRCRTACPVGAIGWDDE